MIYYLRIIVLYIQIDYAEITLNNWRQHYTFPIFTHYNYLIIHNKILHGVTECLKNQSLLIISKKIKSGIPDLAVTHIYIIKATIIFDTEEKHIIIHCKKSIQVPRYGYFCSFFEH